MNSPRRGTPDFLFLLLTFLLVGFGIVMVFSASSMIAVTSEIFNHDAWYFTKRQIYWALLGACAMFFFMNLHYNTIKKGFYPFFVLIVLLLILVLFVGEERNGAKSWFGIGPVGVQPSEFAKLAVILYTAVVISKKGEKFRDFKKGLLPVLITVGFIGFLILLQPDFGTFFILLACAGTVIFAGGAKFKHLLVLSAVFLGLGGLIFAFLVSFISDHYMDRIYAFLNPWSDPQDSGYHLIQSLFAFSHGGLTGAGFGQSIQKLHYLPYPYNDFIFSIIGEEFGFIGSSLFLLIYILFLWRGLYIALRSEDPFALLTGVGIVGMMGIQALINIGGVTGSIPITGVTLPLISYGGSSLLISMIGIGILLSISRENNRREKEREK